MAADDNGKTDGKWSASQEEQAELERYMIEASRRHITHGTGLAPGFIEHVLDTDVHLWGMTLHEGAYLTKMPEEPLDSLTDVPEYAMTLWTIAIDEDSVLDAIAQHENGNDDVKFRAEMRQVIPPTSKTRRPLSIIDVALWLAIQDAEEANDKELADRIFYLAYGRSRGDKGQKNLPRQDVRRLNRQNDPVSKVANLMTNPSLFGEAGATLDVTGKGERKRGREVTTAVSFSWEGEGVRIYRAISQYDREVHGAVSSLWADGQRNVTAAQIARAMGIRNPNKKQVERVEESVDLQRRVMCKIDFAEEARGRKLMFDGEEVTPFRFEGNLIAADKTELGTANGKIVMGYVLYRPPIMYKHAATLGQVVSYPQKLLELGSGSNTEQSIILRRELLRRVYRIKNAYKNARANKRGEVNRNVRFTTDDKHPGRSLFERANVNQKDRDARKRAMDLVIGILDGLAERGEIVGYKPITESGRGGTRTVGAELIL